MHLLNARRGLRRHHQHNIGKVAQFTTYSYPHYGFGLMVASTLLLILAALIRRKQLKLAGDAAENV